ncbi:MAG: metal ABC transporter permease [Candidatus Goldbacteria bacterium]|nr:metal ABC transporter permease [Candidatus Goldiibacteriota bacterium]
MDELFAKAIITASIAGFGCGLIGVFIFLLNIPFIGVAIAHSAMAGGIWAIIFNLPSKLLAILVSFFTAIFIGPVTDRAKTNPNVSLSIIFSFVMGIAFFGVGLLEGKNQLVTNFLWGNILLSGWKGILLQTAVLIVVILFIFINFRDFSVFLFNREIAATLGVNVNFILYFILFLIGVIVTLNLDIIGGLMLFALIITPPAIAYQWTFDLKKFFVISALTGALGGIGGVIISFAFNFPVSATVVIFISILFFISAFISPKRAKYGE